MGEQIAVTWKRLYLRPCSATRVIAGVETGPPNVDGLPKPASSISTSSTFGAPSGGLGVMLIVQSATDASSVLPIVPPKFGSGIGNTVRSGLNFPIASASDSFNAPMPLLSPWTTERSSAPASACSMPRRCSSSKTAMIPAEPGGRFSPILSWISFSTRWSTNLPITPPATAPTATDASSGGANKPTASPTPPPQPIPLRPRLSPVCCTATLPSSACVTRITPSISSLFSLTSAISDSKSWRRLVDVLVAGDEDIGRRVSHHVSPFIALPEGGESKEEGADGLHASSICSGRLVQLG